MDKLITDFDNRLVIILSSAQKDVFAMESFNQKAVLLEFFPRKSLYMRSNNFTFDFEKEVIEANDELPYDGSNYDISELRIVDFEKVEDLKYRRDQIMDLLGFEVEGTNEKYREFAEFMEEHGKPPKE